MLRSEKCGRLARRIQILIVFFMSDGTFATVSRITNWDKRTVARWHGRFSGCKKSISGIRAALGQAALGQASKDQQGAPGGGKKVVRGGGGGGGHLYACSAARQA